MKRKETKAEKAADKRIERIYYATCSGVAIDVMDIGKVFAFGRLKIEAGEDDAALASSLKNYVATLAKN
jgi:hypothetical protein